MFPDVFHIVRREKSLPRDHQLTVVSMILGINCGENMGGPTFVFSLANAFALGKGSVHPAQG